jgi:putative ABC transport system substrate-binding protein
MLAAGHAIPAMYEFREAVVDGGLVSYGTDIADAYRRAGTYTARILGARSQPTSVIQSTRQQLRTCRVLNNLEGLLREEVAPAN